MSVTKEKKYEHDEQFIEIVDSLKGMMDSEPPESPLDFMKDMTLEDINNLEGAKLKKQKPSNNPLSFLKDMSLDDINNLEGTKKKK